MAEIPKTENQDVVDTFARVFHTSFTKAYRDCNDSRLAFVRAYSVCADKFSSQDTSYKLSEYYCRMNKLYSEYRLAQGPDKVKLAKEIVYYARLICTQRPASKKAVDGFTHNIRQFLDRNS